MTKICEFSWTVHVGWYMNMIHLTHCCMILPFVQCRCDLSGMLCGNFPVTLIVAAGEQLPRVGNSWKNKQVQVWAQSDPAACEKMNKPLWKVFPNHCISHWTTVAWNRLQVDLYQLGCLKVLQVLYRKRQKYSKEGACLMLQKCQVRLLHLQNTFYLSGLYPVEGSVGYWPGDGISF